MKTVLPVLMPVMKRPAVKVFELREAVVSRTPVMKSRLANMMTARRPRMLFKGTERMEATMAPSTKRTKMELAETCNKEKL